MINEELKTKFVEETKKVSDPLEALLLIEVDPSGTISTTLASGSGIAFLMGITQAVEDATNDAGLPFEVLLQQMLLIHKVGPVNYLKGVGVGNVD